jgi:hypothetical protein
VEKCESLFCQLAGEPIPRRTGLNAPVRGHAAGCPSNPPSSDAGPVQ